MREIDAEHKTVWDYVAPCPEVLSCERLPGDRTLVGQEGPCQIVELDGNKDIRSTINLTHARSSTSPAASVLSQARQRTHPVGT